MGEAKRRQTDTRRRLQEFAAEARTGSGTNIVMQVSVVRRSQMIAGVLLHSGNPEFKAFVGLIGDYLAMIADHGPLCLACETQFSASSLPADFLVVNPKLLDTTINSMCMVVGICERCSAHNDDKLAEAGLQRLRQVWPNLAPLGGGVG